jgi:hypothetical protein
MANARRGEIDAELGGRRRTLCLTLGALAELEAAFQAEDLAALARRFESGRIGARDLARIIACGLRGAGEAISDAEAAALSTPEGLPGYVAIVSRLLAATFGAADEGEAPRDPPAPQGA